MNANTMNAGTGTGMGDLGTTGTMGNRMADDVERTANRAHDAVDRTMDQVAPAVDRVAERAHRAVDTVAQRAQPAAEWVQSNVRRVSEQTSYFADSASEYVRQKPLASVAGALAIGYLLGRLMR